MHKRTEIRWEEYPGTSYSPEWEDPGVLIRRITCNSLVTSERSVLEHKEFYTIDHRDDRPKGPACIQIRAHQKEGFLEKSVQLNWRLRDMTHRLTGPAYIYHKTIDGVVTSELRDWYVMGMGLPYLDAYISSYADKQGVLLAYLKQFPQYSLQIAAIAEANRWLTTRIIEILKASSCLMVP